MIKDFLARNSNLDDIILIIIGIIIGGALNLVWKYLVICVRGLIKGIVQFFHFIRRKITGDYTINEILKIIEKPESDRSKKERAIITLLKEKGFDFDKYN